ncbi:PDZ and LIM domain protein Zasp, partial [Trichinella pseudospiralis]
LHYLFGENQKKKKNMADETVTVRMSRSDPSIIWGFRLQGGLDFNEPLTISKVVAGSLAERAGLIEGDHVVRIAGHHADSMQHKDAQDAIISSNNDVEIVVERRGCRVWKPAVMTTDDKFTPVKYSLAHDNRKVHDSYFSDNSQQQQKPPPPPPPISHIEKFNKISNQYTSDSSPGYSKHRTADSYLHETGGLFGTDANLQKQNQQHQPSFIHSETLRLIREDEAKNRLTPSNYTDSRGEPYAYSKSIHQSATFRRLMAAMRTESMRDTPRGIQERSTPARPSGGPVCDTCGRHILGVFCKAGDKCFHGECYKCSTCGTSLKNTGYFMVNDKLYCNIHARQQQQNLFQATAPQDPSIFSYRGAPPQPSPKHSDPPKAFYQPDVLKPSLSPIAQVHSAPLSPSSRGIPTHSVSKMPGNYIRQFKQEMESTNQWSTAVPEAPFSAERGGYPYQHEMHTADKSDTVDQQPTTITDTDCNSDSDTLLLDNNKDAEWGLDEKCLSQSDASVSLLGKEVHDAITAKSATAVKPAPRRQKSTNNYSNPFTQMDNQVVTANDIVCAHLALYQRGGSRTVGAYVPRRGRGVLKQIGESLRIPVCEACHREIRGPFVLALGKSWCPDHFVCSHPECRRKLLDVGFVEEGGFIYCEFCFERYLAPSCFKCNRSIVGDCLTALDRKWHPECFCCAHCHKPFGNSCFFLEDGKPYCEQDWNTLFTTKCCACQFPIEAGDRWVEALGNAYHSNCFTCTVCMKNLEGENFYVKGNRPYCKAHA